MKFPTQFQFTPDESDPALDTIRQHAYREGQRRRMNNIDEFARSGMLGSSGMQDVLYNNELATSRSIEEGRNQVFEQQRKFKEELDMLRLRSMLAKEQQGGIDLGGIGKLLSLAPLLFGDGAGAGIGVTSMGQQGWQWPTGQV